MELTTCLELKIFLERLVFSKKFVSHVRGKEVSVILEEMPA